MAELIEITTALEKVKGFSPLERILLTCSGTLQGTLSAYFGQEILVKVVRQTVDDSGVIGRLAHLHDKYVVVCEANSRLTIEREDVRGRVLAGDLGIGQVLETLGLRPSFQLDQVGEDPHHFWRLYTLRAPGVVYAIRESFPKTLYREVQPA
jgi:hypothetical protein